MQAIDERAEYAQALDALAHYAAESKRQDAVGRLGSCWGPNVAAPMVAQPREVFTTVTSRSPAPQGANGRSFKPYNGGTVGGLAGQSGQRPGAPRRNRTAHAISRCAVERTASIVAMTTIAGVDMSVPFVDQILRYVVSRRPSFRSVLPRSPHLWCPRAQRLADQLDRSVPPPDKSSQPEGISASRSLRLARDSGHHDAFTCGTYS